MKTFLFLLLTFPLFGQFVTGFISYNGAYDYRPGETVILKYDKVTLYPNIDSINNSTTEALLTLNGISKDSIICALGKGNHVTNKIEIWFAYKGQQDKQRKDIYISNAKHLYGSVSYNNWITSSIFRLIDTAKLNDAVNTIADSFTVYSFYVEMNDSMFIEKVLAKNPRNGNMANMRFTPYSAKFVARFKALNWNNIQYVEGEVGNRWKNILRPKAGW